MERCIQGYELSVNKDKCIDVDECSNSNLTNCSKNAKCLNILGSYECVCEDGFIGNGQTCTRKII